MHIQREPTPYPLVQSVLDSVASWIRPHPEPRHITVLNTCSRADLEQLAEHMHVSTMQLRLLLSCSPVLAAFLARHMALLLAHRMKALGIDASQLARNDAQLLRDLRRRCAACDNQARCEQDLVRDATADTWRDYCPNAGTLDRLAKTL